MFRLQKNGKDAAVHDGKMCTAVVPPGDDRLNRKSATGRSEYNMTLLSCYAMRGSVGSFHERTAANRNRRDYSHRQRDALIAEAKAVMQRSPTVTGPSTEAASQSNRPSAIANSPFDVDA